MNDLKNASAPMLLIRRPKRVFMTPGGTMIDHREQVIPAKRVEIFWQAHVVDTTTNEPVAAYPTLQGKTVGGTQDGNTDQVIAGDYFAALRFVDGQKPDVELLQNNANAGIWAVASTVKGTKPL